MRPEPPPPDGLPDPGAAAREALAWQVSHLSLVFFLDLVEIGRQRDVIDAILFGAVLVANLEPINRDPELANSFATLQAAAPDDLRRPVSINAVAQSLRLPFETARRRIMRMARAGDLVITPRGVYAPARAIGSPEFLATVFGRHARLQRFYEDLRTLGALADHVAADDGPAPPEPPVRITNRAIAEYMMRVIDAFNTLTEDPVTGFLLMQLVRLNTEHMGPDEFVAWVQNPHVLGVPVRNGRLAKTLRYSPETARRHALRLEAAGFCVRTRTGLLAVTPDAARPAMEAIVVENLSNVQRLFARLRQLGALAGWDESAAARATAVAVPA